MSEQLADVMRDAITFWTNYSCLNELGQDRMEDEADEMLDRMRAALESHKEPTHE